jgi:phosphomannomutase
VNSPEREIPPFRFGTDGWRGILADDFTFENAAIAARAVGQTFRPKKGLRPTVFVGYDHRFLAEQFARHTASVLNACGFDAQVLPRPVTSPLLSFITWKQKSPFGVMLTASHNPPQYLGLKVKGSFGGSIAPETVKEIERNLSAKNMPDLLPEPAVTAGIQVIEPYLKYLRSHISPSVFRRLPFHTTFDALYGPAGKIVQQLFKLPDPGHGISVIHTERDPLFGGLKPEPTEQNLGELKRTAKHNRSAAAFALDGDADRLGVLDEHQRYLNTPQVFSLLLYYLAAHKKLKGSVVQAVSLGKISKDIAQEFGLPFKEVSVGFKHVAKAMMSESVILGGEESGGYAFGGLLPERDGILSSLLFLEMMTERKMRPGELLKEIEKRYGPSCFERRDIVLPFQIQDKAAFLKKIQNTFPKKWMGLKVREIRTEDGFKVVFDGGWWILARTSGTEPLVRAYAEFPDALLTKNSLVKLSELLYNILIR